MTYPYYREAKLLIKIYQARAKYLFSLFVVQYLSDKLETTSKENNDIDKKMEVTVISELVL